MPGCGSGAVVCSCSLLFGCHLGARQAETQITPLSRFSRPALSSPTAAASWSVIRWQPASAAPPTPQVPEVVGDQTQPQRHLVGAKAVTGKPRHRDRLLALFNPLFRRPA